MKLSVIIPTYNEEHVIKDCLSSLLKQNYSDFEIVVVDDGSTDETKSIIDTFVNSNTRIKLLTQSHKGAGAARNFGAKNAKGQIFVFLDADMSFDKVFLKKLVAPIVSGSAIGTFSKDEHVSNWSNVWARCWNWNLNLPDKRRLPLHYPNTQKVFRAILASKFKKVNGFTPGGYTDDWSLSEKLNEKAQAASDAHFYHKNPDSLGEVYLQSKWSAKRKYKLGVVGFIIALARVSLPISILIGILKSLIHTEWRFLVFKVIYDLGQTVGIVSYYGSKKGTK